jgi:hypothetical protein
MELLPNSVVDIIYSFDSKYRDIYDTVIDTLTLYFRLPIINDVRYINEIHKNKLYKLWRNNINIDTDGIYGDINNNRDELPRWLEVGLDGDELYGTYDMILKHPYGPYMEVIGNSVLDYIYITNSNKLIEINNRSK